MNLQEIRMTCKRDRLFLFAFIVFLITIIVPLCREGVIIHDELQYRFWMYSGYWNTAKTVARINIEQGRMLATPIQALLLGLGYLSQETFIFKIVQILFLALTVVAFYILLQRLFQNRNFSLFCGLSIAAFLPVTFEHTMPNAYVTLFPLWLLFFSMILFWDWLEGRNFGKLLVSMIFFFVTMCSYEAFVVYVAAYVLMVVYKRGLRRGLCAWQELLPPVAVCVLYLISYWAARQIYPSHYVGNQISLADPAAILRTAFGLFRSSFPGVILTVPKYHYLLRIYRHITPDDVARLFLLTGAYAVMVVILFRSSAKSSSPAARHPAFTGACLLLLTLLPMLPMAITVHYQEIYATESYWGVPPSYFGYYSATLFCCALLWLICKKLPQKAAPWIFILCALAILIPTQLMSGEFAEENEKNFQRLETIEEMVKSSIIQNLAGDTICTTDLFQTRNALAIDDSYWMEYTAASGKMIQIVNQEGTAADDRLYFDDTRFYIWHGTALCVLSKEPLSGYSATPYLADTYLTVDYSGSYQQGDWYVCCFTYADGMLTPASVETFVAA